MAHFFGTGGAGQLINAARDRPEANAASLFPAAARANKSIFYDRQGNARSVAGVYAELNRRYQVARANVRPGRRADGGCSQYAGAARAPARRPTPDAAPQVPDTAGHHQRVRRGFRAAGRGDRRTGVPVAVSERRASRRRARRGVADCLRAVEHANGFAAAQDQQRSDRDRPGGDGAGCAGAARSLPRHAAGCAQSLPRQRPRVSRPRLARDGRFGTASGRLTNHQQFQRFMVNALLNIAAYCSTHPVPSCGTSSWLRSSMIVRQFLQWLRTAGAAERAEATSALARAYLYSDLSPDDRAATEGRADHVARRSVAAGARGAGAGAGIQRSVAAAGHPRARLRPAGGRELGARAFAAADGRRSGRCGRDRAAADSGRDRAPRRLALRGLRGHRRGRRSPKPAWC